MEEEKRSRVLGAILGAFVADAASLGLHWLYDTARLAELVGGPEGDAAFHTPNEDDYKGVMGYFAAHGKQYGCLSHYGEQSFVMLKTLAESKDGCTYGGGAYLDAFVKHFGFGGAFHGYIDTPTRGTLSNVIVREKELENKINTIPYKGTESDRHLMLVKARGTVAKFGSDKEQAHTYMQKAIAATHENDLFEEHCRFGLLVVDMLQSAAHEPAGCNDDQVPALSKLPPLVALLRPEDDKVFLAAVESAVRTTNNNDLAVNLGIAAARMIQTCLQTPTPSIAKVLRSASDSSAEARKYVDVALDFATKTDLSPVAAAERFGKACMLRSAFPCIVHNLATQPSFRAAVNENIKAGGDNCGRAIVIGAVFGALHGIGGHKGIPQLWINILFERNPRIKTLLHKLGLMD